MAHTCHAIGCKKPVPPEMFACRVHWFSLTKTLQADIWATYRTGQCDDMNPSAAYCTAAKAAVMYLARREGRTVTGQEPELLLYDVLGRDVK